MMDEVADNPPEPARVGQLFGVRCVATSGRGGSGMAELTSAIADALAERKAGRVHVRYPDALRRDADRVAEAIPAELRSSVERDRAIALWALLSLEDDDELVDVPEALRERCRDVHGSAGARDLDQEVIAARYAFLDAQAPGLYTRATREREKHPLSQRIDRVLLHPTWGFAVFVVLMLALFQTLFAWADPAIGLIEDGFAALQVALSGQLPEGLLRSVLVEGVIGGAGNVVVFLPQILLLFLFIGVLEDSGYMARVAYLMDRIMRSLGLHGRAFVPMLSGFACAVPAILATRTMERRRDRLLTMMVIPLMTCSARLPVYTLIIAALFPPTSPFGLPVQGLLMVALYLFSTGTALLAALVLGRTVIRGRRVPLILELPPYRMPAMRSVFRLMFERALVFLKEAGTVILALTIGLWVLLSFPRASDAANPAQNAAKTPATAIEHSYGGRLGKAIEPAIEPLGFDWKIGIGIIGAFAAREVFVSTMGLVYGIGESDDAAAPLREKIRAETKADGRPAYRALTGLSLLVFFALACQCMSTLAVVRRETRTWRWPLFMFAYMTGLAYAASFIVFQTGRLLGF
jgi:ferrous iron transport protein B